MFREDNVESVGDMGDGAFESDSFDYFQVVIELSTCTRIGFTGLGKYLLVIVFVDASLQLQLQLSGDPLHLHTPIIVNNVHSGNRLSQEKCSLSKLCA